MSTAALLPPPLGAALAATLSSLGELVCDEEDATIALLGTGTGRGSSSSALDNAGSDEEIMELIFEKMLQKHMDTLKEEL